MATPLVVDGAVKLVTAATSQAYLGSSKAKETNVLLPELRRQFYQFNRVSSTGGYITIKVHDDSIPKPNQLIVMSSSGFQKDKMVKGINVNIRNSTIPSKAMKVVSENGKGPSKRCIVLDIEGTTTPISFVTDVLFPYARENVSRHLYETYGSDETHEDIKLLRAQVEEDLEKGISGAVPIPPVDASKDDIIAALVTNVEAMIKADRKITSLKQLQGHIWQTGFRNDELEGVVFDDVPKAFEKWLSLGIKVYIYSSGSRLAQRLIFGYTNYGDLRKYLCGFFDTTVGNKKESRSYIEIAESLGVDNRSDILFLTDVYQEAMAAKSAGLEVIISVRPGNGPLPENHGFRTIKSFLEIEP